MKSLLTLLALAGLLSAIARADRSLTLTWDANPPVELVTEYEIFVDGKLTTSVIINTAQVIIPDAKCAVTVVAVSNAGKSDPSTPLLIPASPSNPKGVRVTAILRTTVSTP